MVKVEPFDTARHLDNPEVISHYLAEALETGDHKLIVRAITNVLRASRIADIASAHWPLSHEPVLEKQSIA